MQSICKYCAASQTSKCPLATTEHEHAVLSLACEAHAEHATVFQTCSANVVAQILKHRLASAETQRVVPLPGVIDRMSYIAPYAQQNQKRFMPLKRALVDYKTSPSFVLLLQKPSKPAMPLPAASADADLPPHLTSKAASAQAAPAKPPRVQQPIATAKLLRSGSDAAGKPPGYTQASPSGDNSGKSVSDQQVSPRFMQLIESSPYLSNIQSRVSYLMSLGI